MKDLYAFMTGKLLGDGTIVKQAGRAPRFSMLHRLEDKSYIETCHNYLKDFFSLSPVLYKKSLNPNLNKGFSECYYCYSKKNNITEDLYYLWYPNKRKSLPKAFIENYFSDFSLAVWYQDDGHLKVENGRARKIVLSTECFTDNEIKFLQHLILTKYNIYLHMDKQRRLVLYNTKKIMHFLFLVRPFLYPGMDRKDIISFETISINRRKRTTISLPLPIPSGKPTFFINNFLLHTKQILDSIQNKNFYVIYYPLLSNRTFNHKYQIVIDAHSLTSMDEIKRKTGLTYNEIAYLCLLIENKKIAQGD